MEIQTIKVSEQDRVLVSGFMGEEYPLEIDWNRLMPVVEKIEAIHDNFHGYFGVYISSNSCTIQGTRLNTTPENPHYAYFNEITDDTKLSATWLAVISFIQWLKQQQGTIL